MKTILSQKLQHLRKKRNWTQDELGKLIGIHGRSIGKYEAGMSNPSRETLQKLANIFEVPMEYFLVEEENTLVSVPIRDKKLLKYFLEVDRMDDEAKKVIMSVIEGMIAKEKEKKSK
jgi:transcriptional regulator with XRE-family HTH domain